MTATLLALLAENPQGLTLAQLPEGAGRELGPRLADGRVTLDTSSGVDVYRLGKAPEAPKPKAAPTSRMVPIALLDALADAVGVAKGTPVAEMVEAVEAIRDSARKPAPDFIANASQQRRVQVIERYCGISELVAAHMKHGSPADCFCGENEWARDRLADGTWRYEDAVIDFVAEAVKEKIAPRLAPATQAPALPVGWRARYERTAPSGADLAVVPDSAGWSWSIIDGSQTLARGVVEVDDPTKAIGCCDAVAAVLA